MIQKNQVKIIVKYISSDFFYKISQKKKKKKKKKNQWNNTLIDFIHKRGDPIIVIEIRNTIYCFY